MNEASGQDLMWAANDSAELRYVWGWRAANAASQVHVISPQEVEGRRWCYYSTPVYTFKGHLETFPTAADESKAAVFNDNMHTVIRSLQKHAKYYFCFKTQPSEMKTNVSASLN